MEGLARCLLTHTHLDHIGAWRLTHANRQKRVFRQDVMHRSDAAKLGVRPGDDAAIAVLACEPLRRSVAGAALAALNAQPASPGRPGTPACRDPCCPPVSS